MSLGPAFVQSRDLKRCAGSGQGAEAWGRKFHECTTHSGHEVLRHSLFACQVRKNTNETMPRIRTARSAKTEGPGSAWRASSRIAAFTEAVKTAIANNVAP